MPNRHMKLVINVDDENVDVLTPLASSSVTDALGYTPMDSSDRGATNGVASLTSGKVPASELPSYVDDVIEGYYYNSNFYSDSAHTQLITGEAGKIYVDLSANSSYRYTGSAYVEISQSITVDSAMSTSSTNPVQNRIITEAINNIHSMFTLLSGTINVSSPGASDGSVVTCTKSGHSITGTITNESCTLNLIAGVWSVTVTDDTQSLTNSTSLTVQVDTSYNVDLPLKAVVNITAQYMSNNSTVTCTNGVDTITGTVSSESCVILLTSGTWDITVTDTSTVSRSTTLTVQNGNRYNVNLSLTTYQKMQKWVREGTIQSHYSIGDQITVTRAGSNMVFDVVAFDVATPFDTTKTHSMTLVAHYMPDYGMFDNKEPNNSNTGRRDYGNNRYKDSNIRLWLNSDGAAGSWWTAQHEYDAAPDYATTKAGFMNGFDADFLEVIGETKIKVVKPNVDGGSYEELVDKFYLPSTTEVGLDNENSIAEGALFPYFDSNTKRTKSKSGGSASGWWLRTPNSGLSYSVRRVDSSGARNYIYAYNAIGVAPACNII